MGKVVKMVSIIFVLVLFLNLTACEYKTKVSISGLVECQETQESISGVEINIAGKTNTSKVDGTWQINNLEQGKYDLIACKAGYFNYYDQIIINQQTSTYNLLMERKGYNVTKEIEGKGQINLEPLKEIYFYGNEITVTATADKGWEFKQWQGDLTGEKSLISFDIDESKDIKAVFKKKGFSLDISTIGNGHVIISPEKESYNCGDEIIVTALAQEGWFFSQWQKDLIGNNNTKTFIIDSNKTIIAYFKKYASLSGKIKVEHNFPYSVVESVSSYATQKKASYLDSDIELENNEKEDELIIAFSSVSSEKEREDYLANMGYVILDQIPILNAYLVKEVETKETISILNVPEIKYIHRNNNLKSLASKYPNDELYKYQWHYPLIRLPQAWSTTTGCDSVRIAVLDTGLGPHPDLQSNIDIEYGYNFVDDNCDYQDNHGHGSHVAGIIAADSNNFLGVSGVMWNVDLLPIKVLDDDGKGDSWALSKGILYAAGLLDEPYNSKPVDVINLSLGSKEEVPIITDAIDSIATNTDTLLVAAAGNDGSSSIVYPAALSEVIAVGAVDFNYPHAPQKAEYSNFGNKLDIVGPGGDMSVDTNNNELLDGVLSTSLDKYYLLQGTSMATPHIAGVIGLMLANNINHSQVREILERTSMRLTENSYELEYGHGLVNAYWAVHNVEKLKIIVGTLKNDTIDVLVKTEINPQGGEYYLSSIPPGEYRVFAWVDVKDNNSIEVGDYFAMTEILSFKAGKNYSLNAIISELEKTGSYKELSVEEIIILN